MKKHTALINVDSKLFYPTDVKLTLLIVDIVSTFCAARHLAHLVFFVFKLFALIGFALMVFVLLYLCGFMAAHSGLFYRFSLVVLVLYILC